MSTSGPDQAAAGYVSGYASHWEPVLAPAVERLLDRLDPAVVELQRRSGELRPKLLDLGTGTGQLAFSARRRWPDVEVVGIDSDGAMLAAAQRRVVERGLGGDDLSFARARAEQIPYEGGSFDIVASSFLIQLVASRSAVFAEVRRVLRRAGRFGAVSWLAPGPTFRPREIVIETLSDLDPDPPPAYEFPSPADLAQQLRQAGFPRVSSRAEVLVRNWSVESYLGYVENSGWRANLARLPGEGAADRLDRIRRGLETLPASSLTWRRRIVIAIASRE